MPTAQEIRTALEGHPNRLVAQRYGWGMGKAQRWRKRLGLAPYPRGSKGPGSTEHTILAVLQPAGTWHPTAQLRGLRTYDITYALHALLRKGWMQRRWVEHHYEYALTEDA